MLTMMRKENKERVRSRGAGTYPIVEVDDTVNYAAGGGVGVLRLQI